MGMRISAEALAWWLWVSKWATRVFGAASVVAGVLVKVAPSALGFDADKSTDELVQRIAQIAFPGLLIAVPIIESLRRRFERKSLWPLVKEILDEFRKQIYPRDELHLHRVTLFKRCAWVLRKRFFSFRGWGWLKIIERSGHTSRNSRTVFFAPNDEDKAEGVAGLAWAWNTVVYREELPDVRNGAPSERAFKLYAEGSNTSIDLVKQLRPASRSLCGIPVEIGGRVWGVLVVDSRVTKLPQDKIEQHYPLAAKFLSRILERL
jgi:hypothetical protein